MTITISRRTIRGVLTFLFLALVATACNGGNGGGSADNAKTQLAAQADVNAYQGKALAAVKYPVDQMNTFLEREQQREKLLRFNNPAKIGYVYVFNQGVKEPIGYYTIKGKVSSTNSQLTPTDQVLWTCKTNHGCQPVVVHSPSDDGSYGENEQGYFFYTSEDVYVFIPLQMSPIYMDAPLKVFNVPQLNDSSQKPSSVGETVDQRDKNRIQAEKDSKSAVTATTKP